MAAPLPPPAAASPVTRRARGLCRLVVLLPAALALAGCVSPTGEVILPTAGRIPATTVASEAPAVPPPGTPVVLAAPVPASAPLDAIPDDLALGKMHFRDAHYGLAEMHFRRVTEQANRNLEAWLGLAASYDKLKRFDLADRAYARAFAIAGPMPELLNNRGYSYLLRGDIRRATADLSAAAAAEPDNQSIRNNLALLEARVRRRF